MLERDAHYSKLRSNKLLDKHPSLKPTYRTILYDWLSEVSHECKFHRETYHMALDFIDRYLAAKSNLGKLQLQLIGTTCLFMAAKFEEITPPTAAEFADLTDGACKPQDIIESEISILETIDWDITPVTPNNWLSMYLQILLKEESDQVKDSFIIPETNGIFNWTHKRIASVIDLALLHVNSLRFSNSILTASALYHFTEEATVRQCTGYGPRELAECVRWLEPFVEAIKAIREPAFIASCETSPQLHSHIATANLLETITVKEEADAADVENIPRGIKRKACSQDYDQILLTPSKPTTLLTPPRSARKSRRCTVEV